MLLLRSRWHRLRRDGAIAAAGLRSWLPLLFSSCVVTGLILVAQALHIERLRNGMIQRTALQQLDFLAENLATETRDWAHVEETHAQARRLPGNNDGNGPFTRDTFLRTPYVLVLDRHGEPVSSAHWHEGNGRIEPLPSGLVAQLLSAIPERRRLQPRTVLARVGPVPFLLSAQLIRGSSPTASPAGRLVFVRPIGAAEGGIARPALGLQDYRIEPLQSLDSPPLGPLAIAVRAPRWEGTEPLQISIFHPARERQQALRSFALLLLVNTGLVAVLLGRSVYQHRRQRRQACLQQRQQRRLQRALHRHENLDPLTGLLNRPGLLSALERQRRQSPQQARALLQIDIRQFALINTSSGRAFGDRVLLALAAWLQQRLPEPAILARTGGDEFSCALGGRSSLELRATILQISEELQQLALPVDGQILHLSVRAGARLLAELSPAAALQEAGVALDMARRSGGQPCRFYGDEPTAMQSTVTIQRLNQELVTALRQRRIALFCQAAWRIQDSRLPAVYIELLARLRDPRSESHCWSEELVEAATQCGTMPLLDAHVLELGFAHLARLLAHRGTDSPVAGLVYAFNVTPDTLLGTDFVGSIERMLEREQLDPSRVCFEITEQTAARDPAAVRVVMERLRRLGFRLSLDDFGAGMTSLSHICQLPLDFVKIDKSFVMDVKNNKVSRLTVEYLVRLGRELGFQTIAEGVEDLSRLFLLRDLGVDIAQGYATARPGPFNPLADDSFARCGGDRLGSGPGSWPPA